MDNIEKFILFAISSVGVIITACILGTVSGCSQPEYVAPTPSAKVAEIAQVSGAGGIKIQSVTIDGVEYLVATTYRGVAMCRK